MERRILSHPSIAEVLSNYPEALWNRAVVALILKGIHSIKFQHPLLELSIEELESCCDCSYKEDIQMPNFIDELKAIKSELFKLDKKIDQTARTTRKDLACNNEEFIRNAKHPINSVRADTLAHEKNKATGYGAQECKRRSCLGRKACAKSRRKSVSEIRAAEHIKLLKLRSNCKSVPKNSLHSRKRGVIRRTPSYLKNVQSRILSNIERDKIQYKMRQQCNFQTNSIPQPSNNERRDLLRIGGEGHLIREADRYLDNPIISHFTQVGNPRADFRPQLANKRLAEEYRSDHPMGYGENNKFYHEGKPQRYQRPDYSKESVSQSSSNEFKSSRGFTEK